MSSLQTDLSIYHKFNFENPPVGVKFLLNKPEGIKQFDKTDYYTKFTKNGVDSSIIRRYKGTISQAK